MITIYRYKFCRKCPVDDAFDNYKAKFKANRIIKAEDILAAIDALPEKIFQEDLTAELACRLQCKVKTVGHHKGVKVTCKV